MSGHELSSRSHEGNTLGRAFVRLADTMVVGYDVVELCQDMVDNCVSLLNPAAASITLHGDGEGLEVLAATTEDTRLLSQFELRSGTGPCMDAYLTGSPVHAADLAAHLQQWPTFTPLALAQGYTAIYALPLRLREERIGALSLYCDELRPMSARNLGFAQALADVATIGILHQRVLSETATINGHLQVALDSRVVIEQAKGILVGRYHLTPDPAFAILRAYSRNTNQRLAVVAAAIIAGTADLDAILAQSKRPDDRTHP